MNPTVYTFYLFNIENDFPSLHWSGNSAKTCVFNSGHSLCATFQISSCQNVSLWHSRKDSETCYQLLGKKNPLLIEKYTAV